MNDQNNEPVEDAEVVSEEADLQSAPTGDNSQLQNRLNLESMINRYVADLEKLKEKLKSQKEMLESALNNNPEYAQASEKVKETTRVKTAIKQRILKDDALALVADTVNGIKDEIKDTQAGLSSYVQQYYQASGMNQIIGEDGEVREIVVVTKLVKKTSKFRP